MEEVVPEELEHVPIPGFRPSSIHVKFWQRKKKLKNASWSCFGIKDICVDDWKLNNFKVFVREPAFEKKRFISSKNQIGMSKKVYCL